MGVFRLFLALSVLLGHTRGHGFFGLSFVYPEIAVQSFFIISGFYMALVLNEKYNQPGQYTMFLKQRFLRLYPTYFILITAVVLVDLAVYGITGHQWGSIKSWHDNTHLLTPATFVCLALENVAVHGRHVSAVRRLRYLADTAGGCNPDFDPFRRLPLTWYYNYPGESNDGLNWVNSHVVNIPSETSPAHFHPPKAIGGGGGIPQSEMYLVLDPQAYQLNTWGRTASLITFADLRDLRRYEQHSLAPGRFVYIPPGTGHRGLDVFVNVLTIPGFKPHNEYYIDRDIRDTTDGKSPYNENLLESKNYTRIEELL